MSHEREYIKSFDAQCPIGTKVLILVDGVLTPTKTWSHGGIAGNGKNRVPSVFVECVEKAVPIASLRFE